MDPDALPLARATVDRAAALRVDPAALTAARADAGTRVLLVRDGSVATTGPDAGSSDPWAELPAGAALLVLDPVAAAAAAGGNPGEDAWLYLGRDDDAVWFALRLPATAATPLAGASSDVLVHAPSPTAPVAGDGPVWTSLRAVGAVLSGYDAGLATTAVALDHWHTRHPRCPRCGGPTDAAAGGWIRVCRQDGSEHYPRTDPAVIMTVVDGADRLLLGRAAAWPEHRFSTLAGFVEAGESLENAVRREVAEEAGVLVGEARYVGSQPWPFPNSLMLGFHARALSTLVAVDGAELAEARWFSRDELAAAVAAGEVVPPGRTSIARALIEDWFGGPLPTLDSDPPEPRPA